jgi:hypothetical protein
MIWLWTPLRRAGGPDDFRSPGLKPERALQALPDGADRADLELYPGQPKPVRLVDARPTEPAPVMLGVVLDRGRGVWPRLQFRLDTAAMT